MEQPTSVTQKMAAYVRRSRVAHLFREFICFLSKHLVSHCHTVELKPVTDMNMRYEL